MQGPTSPSPYILDISEIYTFFTMMKQIFALLALLASASAFVPVGTSAGM
jgi:hypothetical protein